MRQRFTMPFYDGGWKKFKTARIAEWKVLWNNGDGGVRLQLKDAKERPRKCMQMSGEDVLLQKDPGNHRKRRSAPHNFSDVEYISP